MGRHSPRNVAAPQLDFGFKTPAKKRKAKRGRPKKQGAGVAHLRREVNPRHPLHVTLRMKPHVWQLRSQRCYRVLERVFFVAAARVDARVAHFSVQHNHVHLVLEARDGEALARAMQAMTIRMAKGLNKLMDRKGAVFADRYHSRLLRTPTEVRRVLVYVLCNARKHLARFEHKFSVAWIDPYSSSAWFEGWTTCPPKPSGPAPVATATTWLLSTGWRERGGGPINANEIVSAPV